MLLDMVGSTVYNYAFPPSSHMGCECHILLAGPNIQLTRCSSLLRPTPNTRLKRRDRLKSFNQRLHRGQFYSISKAFHGTSLASYTPNYVGAIMNRVFIDLTEDRNHQLQRGMLVYGQVSSEATTTESHVATTSMKRTWSSSEFGKGHETTPVSHNLLRTPAKRQQSINSILEVSGQYDDCASDHPSNLRTPGSLNSASKSLSSTSSYCSAGTDPRVRSGIGAYHPSSFSQYPHETPTKRQRHASTIGGDHGKDIFGRHRSRTLSLEPGERRGIPKEVTFDVLEDSDDDIPEEIIQANNVLTPDDYTDEEDLERLIRQLYLETKTIVPRQAQSNIEIREFVETARLGTVTCTVGKSVEFRASIEFPHGSFMRIDSIYKTASNATKLVGRLLMRTYTQSGLMAKRCNELVWIDTDTQVTRSLDEVKKIRKIFFTSQQYPKFSAKDDPDAFLALNQQQEFGRLYCRWKRTNIIENGKHIEENISRLSSEETDSIDATREACVQSSQLQVEWQGQQPTKGGRYVDCVPHWEIEDGACEMKDIQKYTYGDAFCGGGGASRGAVEAGLHVAWGFDYEKKAIRTYELNFQRNGTDCRLESVDTFILSAGQVGLRFQVDVLHISPPCQPFSPAHTIPNERQDDANEAALCSTQQLLEVVRPRVVIMEETEGLVGRHPEWFSMLIHIFNNVGYSVRWRRLDCKKYGLPQERRRLCILAAA